MHVTFSIAGTTFLVFCVFAIAAAGYLLGRVTIQGVSLGYRRCLCGRPALRLLLLWEPVRNSSP
ncbi:MAG: hypothetical protein ACLT9P_05760 [Evtepia gabavorous]